MAEHKVVILRGVSGSGKSTYIKNCFPESLVVSSDHYFTDEDGRYNFNAKLLPSAHAWCLRKFIELAKFISQLEGSQTIVVDNTNTTVAEFAPYAAIGAAYGFEVEIITLDITTYTAHPRNVHNVPVESVHRQRANLLKNNPLIPKWWKHTIIREPGWEEASHDD